MKSTVYKISWSDYQKDPSTLTQVLNQYTNHLKGKVAIKTHFGEPGNNNAFRGNDIKPVTDWVLSQKLDAFLTDANTLYTGFRSDSKSHLETATKHGFAELGLPVVIADGDYPEFTLNYLKNQYNKLPIRMGKELMEADSILCISHVKGHSMFGYGGTLKNLGMGGALPAGKRVLHANIAGTINTDKCAVCGTCMRNCPAQAISIVDKKVVIDYDKCIGCGECVTVCPKKAVEVSEKDSTICEEKTAVYSKGLVQDKPGLYVNFLMNINPVCDCAGTTKPTIMENVGIVVCDDPVAADQASLDWINEVAGKDIFMEVNGVEYSPILKMAEEIGLGSREYTVK